MQAGSAILCACRPDKCRSVSLPRKSPAAPSLRARNPVPAANDRPRLHLQAAQGKRPPVQADSREATREKGQRGKMRGKVSESWDQTDPRKPPPCRYKITLFPGRGVQPAPTLGPLHH